MSRLGLDTPNWLLIMTSWRVCLTTRDPARIMLKTLEVRESLARPDTTRPELGRAEKVESVTDI